MCAATMDRASRCYRPHVIRRLVKSRRSARHATFSFNRSRARSTTAWMRLTGEVSRQSVPRPDDRRSRPRRDHQNHAARRRGGRRSSPMSRKPTSKPRVRITIGDRSIEAMLADSDAARDFASLLPLTLAMDDLFQREKFATPPRAISEHGKRTHDYAVGTIDYGRPDRTWRSSIARTASESPIRPDHPRQDQSGRRSSQCRGHHTRDH